MTTKRLTLAIPEILYYAYPAAEAYVDSHCREDGLARVGRVKFSRAGDELRVSFDAVVNDPGSWSGPVSGLQVVGDVQGRHRDIRLSDGEYRCECGLGAGWERLPSRNADSKPIGTKLTERTKAPTR